MKKINNTIIRAFCLAFLLGAVNGCKDKAPRVEGVYTIWVGSSVVASGHQSNEYTKNDGIITFTNIRSGKTISVPECNILSIESN